MTCPEQVGPDGSSVLSLRVDRVTTDTENDGETLYCTGVDGTKLRVGVRNLREVDTHPETDRWYRFDGIARSESPGAELSFRPGDGSVEAVDVPERRPVPSGLDDAWLIRLGAADDVVAVAVQPRPVGQGGVRPDDPESFEIGAVCLAPCDGSGDTTVYHREEPDIRDEHLLLQHVVSDLSERAGMVLVTGGTARSPVELLHARTDRAAGAGVIRPGAEQALTAHFHANLDRITARTGADSLREATDLDAGAGPVRLEEYDLAVDPADWRRESSVDGLPITDASDPQMTDHDYAKLLESHLDAGDDTTGSAALARCLKAHASRHLPLLRGVATGDSAGQVGCPSLAGRFPG